MFKDLVLANRSYRGFDEDHKFSKEDLMDLVDYARLMPSGKNSQPFKYFLAWEDEIVAAIQPHTKWAGILAELNLPREGSRPTGFIVVLQDLNIEKSIQAPQKDVGIVASAITLAAAEKELGCCMIGSFSASGLKKTLNLNENLAPVFVIALGKPTEKIILKDINADESIAYYRDDNDVHYVPKRRLEDIIVPFNS